RPISSASAAIVSSSLKALPSSPRSNSKLQPGYLKSSPPGASMTPSSETNSVTVIRAGISSAPRRGPRPRDTTLVLHSPPSLQGTGYSEHERARLQVRRDHRLVLRGRDRGDRPAHRQGLRLPAPHRLVRGHLRPRPRRRRARRPLPGDAQDRLPARGLMAAEAPSFSPALFAFLEE